MLNPVVLTKVISGLLILCIVQVPLQARERSILQPDFVGHIPVRFVTIPGSFFVPIQSVRLLNFSQGPFAIGLIRTAITSLPFSLERPVVFK